MNRIRPLFKWFGSKWQAAKRYPAPRHEVIGEPFAGSAGYSLNYCDKRVLIWEEDPNLKRLWKWLIDSATDKDILEIPVGLPVGTFIPDIGLSHGQALLLKHWQRTNNVGDNFTISPWGHLPGQWTANTRARVADEVYAVKHWEICPPIDMVDLPATWFIDPPYLYNYRYRSTLEPFSHSQLEKFVQTISPKSLVICCEAVEKGTGRIPTYLPFKPSHRSVTSRRKPTQSHHSSEVVYVREPQ